MTDQRKTGKWASISRNRLGAAKGNESPTVGPAAGPTATTPPKPSKQR